jgi:hypothetical protein
MINQQNFALDRYSVVSTKSEVFAQTMQYVMFSLHGSSLAFQIKQ